LVELPLHTTSHQLYFECHAGHVCLDKWLRTSSNIRIRVREVWAKRSKLSSFLHLPKLALPRKKALWKEAHRKEKNFEPPQHYFRNILTGISDPKDAKKWQHKVQVDYELSLFGPGPSCVTRKNPREKRDARDPFLRFTPPGFHAAFFSRCLQLFRQRLSHKSVKAFATMPIGIMGRKSLALIDRGSRRLATRKVKDR